MSAPAVQHVWTSMVLGILSLAWWSTQTLIPGRAVSTSPGSVYFVALNGDDSYPGTESQPWRTLQKAADTLTSGETVYFRAGSYQERIIPKNSGGDGDHYITYASYPGEIAVIDGEGIGVPEDEGLFHIDGLSYIRISGLSIRNSAYTGIYVDHSDHLRIEKNRTYNTASSGIGIWGSHDVIVDHNEVELACSNGMQESLTIAGTDTFEVKNNQVHNGVAGYDKEGICIKDGASNGKVYLNLVHHTAAVGLYVDAWNKHTFNIDIYRNIVHDISANGIALASETGGLLEHVRVCNNITYNNKWAGIWISGCCPVVSFHPMNDLKIINNTVYGNGWDPWGGGIGVDNNADLLDVVIRNNLCSQNLSFQIAIDPAIAQSIVTVDHNLVDGFRNSEGETYGSEPVIGNPWLANPSAADFSLQGNSPAIDRGSSVDAPADDFRGTSRPLDGNGDHTSVVDIGAYEFMRWRLFLPVVYKE